MSILISLIIVLVVAGVCFYVLGLIPMDARLRQIVIALGAVVLLIYLVTRFLPGVL